MARAHTRVFPITIPAILLGVGLGLGKIVRDCSLTCNVGFRLAPLGIVAVALATAPVAALRTRLEARWGYRRWHVASTLFAAASFLLFRLVTYHLQGGLSEAPPSEAAVWLKALRWTYLAFFVWLGTVSVVLVANAFGHVHSSLPARERETGVGYVAAAALAGGLAASRLAGRSASWLLTHGWRYEVVRDNLMIAMAAALVLKAAALPLIRPREHADPRAPAGRVRPDLRGALASVRGDPYLRGLAVLVLVTGVADTMMKYLFYWFVSEQTNASSGRTLYFAGFYVWLNAASLFMMAFGTDRIIRRHGLRLALLSLPVALVFGAASLAVSLAVVVMYVLRVVEGAFRSALYEPGLERLYLSGAGRPVRRSAAGAGRSDGAGGGGRRRGPRDAAGLGRGTVAPDDGRFLPPGAPGVGGSGHRSLVARPARHRRACSAHSSRFTPGRSAIRLKTSRIARLSGVIE